MKLRKFILIPLAYLALLYFSFLMLRITLQYIEIGKITAFLKLKLFVWDNLVWRTSFYIHVFTSMFALIAGFTQFSDKILQKFKKIHRGFGYTYIVSILLFAGPSGLIMGIYAYGGPVAQTAFLVLSVLWIGFTYMGIQTLWKKQFEKHRYFMIRSYALTLSAVTLRCWKFLIANWIGMNPKEMYLIVAWLGFVPNLIIAEIIIARLKRKKNIALRLKN